MFFPGHRENTLLIVLCFLSLLKNNNQKENNESDAVDFYVKEKQVLPGWTGDEGGTVVKSLSKTSC